MSQPIKAVCSYCREVYREGKLIEGKYVTHGICPNCVKSQNKEIDERGQSWQLKQNAVADTAK
jgi:hypothetical protein